MRQAEGRAEELTERGQRVSRLPEVEQRKEKIRESGALKGELRQRERETGSGWGVTGDIRAHRARQRKGQLKQTDADSDI